MKLFQGNEPRGSPPTGPERDICAFASVAGTGAAPGIPKVTIDLPPASELHPGFLFVTTGRWWLRFAH